MKKITINMLSSADKVDGQGVGSAYLEQVSLVKEGSKDLFDVKINDKKDTASVAMITFLVLNTAGVTIVPTTVLALRIAHNSSNPSEIIIPGAIATICSSISGLIMDYMIRKRGEK